MEQNTALLLFVFAFFFLGFLAILFAHRKFMRKSKQNFISEQNARFDEMKEVLSSSHRTLANSYQNLDKRLNGLETSIEILEKTLLTVGQKINLHEEHFSSFENRITFLEEMNKLKFERIQENQMMIQNKLNSIEQGNQELHAKALQTSFEVHLLSKHFKLAKE